MKKKICFVVARFDTANSFLRGHIDALSKDFDIYLVGNAKYGGDVSMLNLVDVFHVNIVRNISLLNDLNAVYRAFRFFRKMQFDAVHSITPKAGLVTAIAGWLAGVRNRTHIFTGQVWATHTGLMRWILKLFDKIIVLLDNHILVDGKSQRAYLEREGVLRKGQALVFGSGSISGVDTARFTPLVDMRNTIRTELNIKENVLCFIFLGRLNRDKGIDELLEAYNRIAKDISDVFLLLVGRDEEHYLDRLQEFPNIVVGKNFHFYGYSAEPEKLLNAGDVFTLPTYREGFGSSVLEAAGVGLPCICSDAYGVLDAYVENKTGLRCHVGNAESLYQCMRKMYDNPILVKEMGEHARQRVISDFNGERITAYWVEFYRQILE